MGKTHDNVDRSIFTLILATELCSFVEVMAGLGGAILLPRYD